MLLNIGVMNALVTALLAGTWFILHALGFGLMNTMLVECLVCCGMTAILVVKGGKGEIKDPVIVPAIAATCLLAAWLLFFGYELWATGVFVERLFAALCYLGFVVFLGVSIGISLIAAFAVNEEAEGRQYPVVVYMVAPFVGVGILVALLAAFCAWMARGSVQQKTFTRT